MVTYSEYLKNVLTQIKDSYNNLSEIKDKAGDLDLIFKELSKINGMCKVISTKVEPEKIPHSDYKPLLSKIEHYLENYSFEQEIETMAPLYSEDVSRIKNMRLKIIEALEDKKMMRDLEDLIEKL